MLKQLRGVGDVTLAKLKELGINDIADLINFLPFKYMDFNAVGDLTTANNNEEVIFKAKIISVARPFRRGKLMVFSAYAQTDDRLSVKLVWFNSNYVSKIITVGKMFRFYGKIHIDKGYEIVNPIYEIYNEQESQFEGIKPIYATKGKIAQGTLYNLVVQAVNCTNIKSIVPQTLRLEHKLLDLMEAYKFSHMPILMEDVELGRNRITLENVVKRICAYRALKECTTRQIFYKNDAILLQQLIESLPYKLTETQNKAVLSIKKILHSNKPLNAMVIGDVGSGKTIVALLCAYYAVCSGKQVAIMAPTEILARQHYNNFKNILQNTDANIALLVGGMDAKSKKSTHFDIANGVANIIVGTHALITKDCKFKNPALMIVDEQHKFGVAQRTALLEKGKNIDTITLSATPIPRSLRLTMFGDIDVIEIDRRFEHNTINTAIVGENKRGDMFKYIVEQCKGGKQAYVVAPSILDDDGKTMEATEAVYAELQSKYGKQVGIVQLHGKMSAKDKAEAMQSFCNGQTDILISTTVIEVGVDVPKASIMAILDADRFGLATLHQLRGRVGRDGSQAYCFLCTTKTQENEIIRLKTLVNETDGVRIAEKDYELRGAGEWLGANQSGVDSSGIKLTIATMQKAKLIADNIDISTMQQELLAYAEQLSLQNISLT